MGRISRIEVDPLEGTLCSSSYSDRFIVRADFEARRPERVWIRGASQAVTRGSFVAPMASLEPMKEKPASPEDERENAEDIGACDGPEIRDNRGRS